MKKIIFVAAWLLLPPALALAQTSSAPKATVKKVVAKKPQPKKAVPAAMANEVALSAEEIAVAQYVQTGLIKCELGASVRVEVDASKAGYFNLSHGSTHYRMHPVNSLTGAVRLEDARGDAVWLQLANKSMLMSQKRGQRLADECLTSQQEAVAQEMKLNPPKSLFETAGAPNK